MTYLASRPAAVRQPPGGGPAHRRVCRRAMTSGGWRRHTVASDAPCEMRSIGMRGIAAGPAFLAWCVLVAAVVAGCGGSADDARTRARGMCERSFAAREASGSPTALDATLRQCANFDDWLSVAFDRPDLLGGRAPMAVLQERCGDTSAGLAGYAVCGTLSLRLATPTPTPKPTRRPTPTHRPSVPEARRAPRPAAVAPRRTPRPAVAAKAFANCTSMHRDYPHGVARTGAHDHVGAGGRGVTSFFTSTALYTANSQMDRDKDGVACEQR